MFVVHKGGSNELAALLYVRLSHAATLMNGVGEGSLLYSYK